MVTSTHWIASAVGMSMLEKGSNAFDAAVAAGMVPATSIFPCAIVAFFGRGTGRARRPIGPGRSRQVDLRIAKGLEKIRFS